VNELEKVREFVARLKDAKIHYTLQSVREALMVTVVSPSAYYEVEFFGDGHIEVQTWGPAHSVQRFSLDEVSGTIIRAVNG